MGNRRGRPMKYAHFIRILRDDVIYSPASIVRYGFVLGFFDKSLKGQALKIQWTKIRHTLARLSANRGFPREGDGWTVIEGQAPMRGWFGARWKQALREKDQPGENRPGSSRLNHLR